MRTVETTPRSIVGADCAPPARILRSDRFAPVFRRQIRLKMNH